MGSLFKYKSHLSVFNDVPQHGPPLLAISSSVPKIRIKGFDYFEAILKTVSQNASSGYVVNSYLFLMFFCRKIK